MPNSFINSNHTHQSILDNKNALKLSKDKKKKDSKYIANEVSLRKKQSYWKMVRFQSQNAITKTMRLCNRVPIQQKDGVKDVLIVQKGNKSAHYGNLMTCGSMWCPTCSNYHRKPMRAKARVGIGNSIKMGYQVKMMTMTIPRHYGNSDFKLKFDAMNKTFRDVIARLRTKCNRLGVKLYSLKGLDITVDSERYDSTHLHLHSLIITDRIVEGLEDWLWKTYKRLQNKRGIKVSKRGFDISDITTDKEITDYIVKTLGTIEQELTSTYKDGKDGKSKGWFKWVQSIVDNPTERDVVIYKDFLQASKGRRCFDFSRNWNELVALKDNQMELDFELPQEDNKEDKEESFSVWRLDRQLWEAIKSLNVEIDVLMIVDNRRRDHKANKRFKELESIINNENYSSFGEQKKNLYCLDLITLLQVETQ